MFLGWAVVGACVSVGALTPFTIGPFVLVAAAAGAAVLVWRRGLNVSCAGLLSGVGLVPLYVAHLNRDGAGQVCTTTGTGQQCVSEWSPWPWLAAGVLLVVAGVAVFLTLRRTMRRAG
jgi:hypothetical protein